MSALHLASLSGNIKIAKKLLLRGADRSLKDLKGQTPCELALENQFDNIYKLLLEKNGILELLNVRTRFKEAVKSYTQVIMFFLLYSFCVIGTVIFCIPYLSYNWFFYFTCLMLLAGLALYILTSLVGPGITLSL